MDGTSYSKANGSDSRLSLSFMLGVIAAVLVAVVALMALGPSVFFFP
jgi:hypothetical protein